MDDRGAGDGIDQRRPHQIPGDRPVDSEQRERRARRQHPKDHDKRAERDHRVEETKAEVEALLDEQVDVLGDALVGIVGGVAEKLHAVMVGPVQPMAQVLLRHPAPPADLEPLVEIELIDRDHDEHRDEHAEKQQLADERIPVLVLQCIVEAGIPLVDHHVDGDDRQLDADHGGQQQPPRQAVLGAEIGRGKPPDGGKRRGEAGHGILLSADVECLRPGAAGAGDANLLRNFVETTLCQRRCLDRLAAVRQTPVLRGFGRACAMPPTG